MSWLCVVPGWTPNGDVAVIRPVQATEQSRGSAPPFSSIFDGAGIGSRSNVSTTEQTRKMGKTRSAEEEWKKAKIKAGTANESA